MKVYEFIKKFDIFSGLPRCARNDGGCRIRHCEPLAKQPKRFAFTLAEIMVVLGVIGVLTAILLPSAYQSRPDENVIKFKKAHNTLYSVIRELVNSDKYYKDGDLGVKADGTPTTPAYFCATFSDMIAIKKADCIEFTHANFNVGLNSYDTLEDAKKTLDRACISQNAPREQIIASDGTIYHEINSIIHFGIPYKDMHSHFSSDYCSTGGGKTSEHCISGRLFSGPNRVWVPDKNGMDTIHKTFCIDIDGINTGEDPFGYGIRADGKILNGARADEWLAKSIQGED